MPVLFPSLFPVDGIYLETSVSRQSVKGLNRCLDKCSCSEMKGKCLKASVVKFYCCSGTQTELTS